jgi:hypothetical protein
MLYCFQRNSVHEAEKFSKKPLMHLPQVSVLGFFEYLLMCPPYLQQEMLVLDCKTNLTRQYGDRTVPTF